jgi:hypothetical protein
VTRDNIQHVTLLYSDEWKRSCNPNAWATQGAAHLVFVHEGVSPQAATLLTVRLSLPLSRLLCSSDAYGA